MKRAYALLNALKNGENLTVMGGVKRPVMQFLDADESQLITMGIYDEYKKKIIFPL